MSVLIDVSHPAHAHFFRPIAEALVADGIQVTLIARDKDITVDLLRSFGIPHEVLPMNRPGAGRISAAFELVRRSWQLRRRIQRLRIEVVLTRNPSGAIAAFGTNALSIFDTDDGRSVGLHYWAARPFADVITSSVHDPEDHGRGHRRYRAIKAQMFLHPHRFTPDPDIQRQYVPDDRPFSVVRFSAHDASHDRKIVGITSHGRASIVKCLLESGPIVLSVEREGLWLVENGCDPVSIPPEHFHHLLAGAQIFVGDSQSVAAEAAVLGVPSLRLSGFTGKSFYLELLQSKGLVQNFRPGEEEKLVAAVKDYCGDAAATKLSVLQRAARLNSDVCDLPDFFVEIVKELRSRNTKRARGKAAA